MDDTLREIVARLEALERRLDRLAPEAAPRDPADRVDPAEGECFFRREERRIVDLIVQLTVDRLEDRMRERRDPPPPGPPPPEPPHRGPRRSR